MPFLNTVGAPLLRAVPVALIFVLLAMAIGWRLLRALGARAQADAWEKAVIALGLGAGVLQFVPFLLGATGHLSLGSVRVVLLVLALGFSPDVVRLCRAGLRAFQTRTRFPTWLRAWMLALLPGLLGALLLALTPTIDPDGLNYHLTVPKRWFQSHELNYLPTYPNSNMPMGVEMLFAAAMAFGGDSAAKLIHFVLGVAGAIGLFHAGRRIAHPALGALAVTAYLYGPFGVCALLGWAYIEGATCFATIVALLSWLIWLERRDLGWLRSAFLLAGIGVSFKITAALVSIGLGAMTWVAWREDESVRASDLRKLPLVALALFTLCSVLPWQLRAAYLTGNPIFPVAAQFIPSRDFSPELAAQWVHFNKDLNWAIHVGAAWSLTQRKAIVLGCQAAVGVAVLALCFHFKTWRRRGIALTVGAIMVIQLSQVGLYIRYWIPMMSVLTLAPLWSARSLFTRRFANHAIVALTAVLSLLNVRKSLTADGSATEVAKTALGLQDQRSYLLDRLQLYPLYEQANRELAPDAGVFMIGYCAGFYLDRRTFCGDIVQGSIRLSGFEDFAADLQSNRVTHLIAPRSLAEGKAPLGVGGASGVGYMVGEQTNRLVGRLLQEHGALLGAASDQGLYRIDWDARP